MNMGTKLFKSGIFDHIRTLSDVVEAYWLLFEKSKQGEAHDDPVVEWCREAESLNQAIRRAVDGRRRDGKMFSKGTCVRASSKASLSKNLEYIADHQPEKFLKASSFEDIYDIVDECSPWGIGRMIRYAVTERIGGYLGIEPKNYLYLHAGPLEGWKRLTGARGTIYRVPWSTVPEPFKTVPVFHLENLLCEFRLVLKPEMLDHG